MTIIILQLYHVIAAMLSTLTSGGN